MSGEEGAPCAGVCPFIAASRFSLIDLIEWKRFIPLPSTTFWTTNPETSVKRMSRQENFKVLGHYHDIA